MANTSRARRSSLLTARGKRNARVLMTLAVLVLAPAVPAVAQVTVTVAMKSGERHTGENPQLSESGEFDLRTKAGVFRAKSSDIAYVEFARSTKDAQARSDARQAVALRTGEIIEGSVIDMGHLMHDDESSEYVIRLRDKTGTVKRYLSTDVARIYF